MTNSRDLLQDVLSYSPSPVIKRLHMRLEYASESEIAKRLFETKDAGCVERLTTVSLKYNKFQREMLHVVKECPKDYILASIMTKGLWQTIFIHPIPRTTIPTFFYNIVKLTSKGGSRLEPRRNQTLFLLKSRPILFGS